MAACQLGGIVEEFSKIFEEKKGEMLNIIKRLVRYVCDKLRICTLKQEITDFLSFCCLGYDALFCNIKS